MEADFLDYDGWRNVRGMKVMRHLLTLLLILCMAACEKPVLEEEGEGKETTGTKTKGNVTLNIRQLGAFSFQTIADGQTDMMPTHLNAAIYDMSGNRLKQVNQKWGDTDYGKTTMRLDAGTYQLVILAHSSEKNPAMTDLTKIQFNNSTGYTDTFLYYTTLTIGDEALSLDLTLDRIGALCRFMVSDTIPEEVTQMKFTYTGGSGHLNAQTGMGVTNSTQMLIATVQPGQEYATFDLYTFPQEEAGQIRLTATALDAVGKALYERKFEVPMQQDQITWLSGNFFVDEKISSGLWTATPNIPLNKWWAREVFFTY